MSGPASAIRPTQQADQTNVPEGYLHGILEKAYRNSPFSSSQKKRNRRVRRYVEHPFSALKGRYRMAVTKAKTKLRNKAQFIMSAICWNIERGIRWAKKELAIIPARGA